MSAKKILVVIVLFLLGMASTAGMRAFNKRETADIDSATKISGGMTVGSFLKGQEGERAIYTGSISAVDPVTVEDAKDKYIKIRLEVEREEEVYNEDKDKYETTRETVSIEEHDCEELLLDDVNVPFSKVHELPKEHETEKSGDKTYEYTYTPSVVEGTFYIKSKKGEIESVKYYKSVDVAGENNKTNIMAIVCIWLILILIGAVIIATDVKGRKRAKAKAERQAEKEQREASKKERETLKNNGETEGE
nr:hypothetical protein [uncultured Ruminococcus sp.]